MDRRNFIQQASAFAFSVWAVGLVSCTEDPNPLSENKGDNSSSNSSSSDISSSRNISSSQETSSSEDSSSDVSSSSETFCQQTTEDILGPFFRENAPIRNQLRNNESPEFHLDLEGVILGEDCMKPIEGASIDLWHADLDGEYDNDSPEFLYRGRNEVDATGQYSFQTILPGRYLNGADYRPSHYHIKVSAEGYQDLVSQIYFKDDPYIDKDPWASDPSARQRILTMQSSGTTRKVSFDIHLASI